MAKIKRVEAVLDLLSLSKSELAEIRKSLKVKPLVKREKKTGGLPKKPDRKIKSIELFPAGQPYFHHEIIESILPEREELLACLEEIDRIDNLLKTGSEPEEEEKIDFSSMIFSAEEEAGEEEEDTLPEIIAEAEAEKADYETESVGNFWEALKEDLPAEEIKIEPEPIILFNDEVVFDKPAVREELFFSSVPLEEKTISQFDEPNEINIKGFLNSLGKKGRRGFAAAAIAIFLVIGGLSVAGQGLSAKSNILSSALNAYRAMLAAKDSASSLDFSGARVNFETAYQEFLSADQELNKMGRSLIYLLEKLPGGSVIGSGAALVEAGENLAKAGNAFSQIASLFVTDNLKDLIGQDSLTEKIAQASGQLKEARLALAGSEQSLGQVKLADLPVEMVEPVNDLKEKIPMIRQAAEQLEFWAGVFLDILGEKQAKKYLLIFQNNSEARPTGGFIGTYGVLDLDRGQVKNLFIDGIFNLDGQLNEKIIPPQPIQKISSAWSTHDANWFADFPTSARKIMLFYEKAGGATADGVISITPTVIERLLELTGPIAMPEYGVTLDKDNFLEIIQYKVEFGYDKQLNQPKKILADFAPKFLARLWEIWPNHAKEVLLVILDSLTEKQALFYFSDQSLQAVFEEQGWAGKILATDKDYLNIINTNINGYKTDKMIEQTIEHEAEIMADGSIIDTVKIVRAHHGGASQYDYYNQVNADYLRVFVPLGSRLLSAEGQTREVVKPPLDYQTLNFKTDAEVAAQENSIRVDEASGTQIFEESGKTVFGNWVYASPGESVEITYRYILPFSLNLAEENVSYSLMMQKQAGSIGSALESVLRFPAGLKIDWQYPADMAAGDAQLIYRVNLDADNFYGVVLKKR
ncbi:MAG: hypothetical protein UU87_C0004G0048 [Parcubacteria group bacterium GW2011_GWA2_42_11]|nr:MAG: hypothetical protein UU87_C0004G0048 [Parcubacteria group bacterium GW2011_GWA2_42_11]